MQRFYIFQSLQDNHLKFGGGNADKGWENPESRLAITMMTNLQGTNDDQAKTRSEDETEVQVWLTIPQMASIVVAFFEPILPLGGIYRNFLRRLLEKRWAHMTSPMAKTKIDGNRWMQPYTKV